MLDNIPGGKFYVRYHYTVNCQKVDKNKNTLENGI